MKTTFFDSSNLGIELIGEFKERTQRDPFITGHSPENDDIVYEGTREKNFPIQPFSQFYEVFAQIKSRKRATLSRPALYA